MAQDVKHSYSGGKTRMSGGFKPGNMNKFIFSGNKKKRKKAGK